MRRNNVRAVVRLGGGGGGRIAVLYQIVAELIARSGSVRRVGYLNLMGRHWRILIWEMT